MRGLGILIGFKFERIKEWPKVLCQFDDCLRSLVVQAIRVPISVSSVGSSTGVHLASVDEIGDFVAVGRTY